MKYEKTKSNILSGKSFYLIIALCLIAIGVAAWMAFDSVGNDDSTPSMPDSSTAENSSSQEDLPKVSSESTPADDVDNEQSDEPYSSETTSSAEEEKNPEPPVATNFVLPINGNIIKNFSDDTLVYSNTYKDMRLHLGIDLVGKEGDTVKACGNGYVVAIIDDAKLGKYVEIDHGKGIIARYCGLDSVSVEEGTTVSAVTKLGTLGTVIDECVDATHLHLEFYRDELPVDPLSVIYPK